MGITLRFFQLLSLAFFLGFATPALGQGDSAAKMEGFPVYRDTGNPQKDAEIYTTQKQAWIATHTEAYIAMQPGLSEEGRAILQNATAKSEHEKRSTIYKNQPHPRKADFPNEADFHLANKEWLEVNAISAEELKQIEQQEAYILHLDEESRNEIGEGNTLEEEVVAKLLWIAENQEAYRMNVNKEEADLMIRKALYLKQKLNKK